MSFRRGTQQCGEIEQSYRKHHPTLVISVTRNPFWIKNLMTTRYSVFDIFDVLTNNRYKKTDSIEEKLVYSIAITTST